MYLERNRVEGGPAPVRSPGAQGLHDLRTPAGWGVDRARAAWAAVGAGSGTRPRAAGPLFDPWEAAAGLHDPAYAGPASVEVEVEDEEPEPEDEPP